MRNETTTVLKALASALQSAENCKVSKNEIWEDKHSERAQRLIFDFMPHGSGFDAGVKLEYFAAAKIVFRTSFHHLDENGCYSGWSDHSVIVTPAFNGFDIRVTGRDQNRIKEYIAEMFQECLGETVIFSESKDRYIRPEVFKPAASIN